LTNLGKIGSAYVGTMSGCHPGKRVHYAPRSRAGRAADRQISPPTKPDSLTRRYAYQVVLLQALRRRGCDVVFSAQQCVCYFLSASRNNGPRVPARCPI
jgi:hypothetical protein